MKIRWVAILILLTCGATVWDRIVSAQVKPERLRIGYAARAVAHSVPFVAKEAGFFAEEGILAEIIHTAGAIAPMALAANEVDMTIMSAFLMIPVSAQNRDIVMLGGFSRYATMVFVARPEIKNAQDLKGKIVGIQRPGDAYEKSARIALKHLGVDPDKDIKMLSLGSNDVMFSALNTNRVAATVLSPPGTLFARRAGMNFMVDLTDLKVEYQGSTITTRRSLVQKNPQLAAKALRAIVRGVHLFKTRKDETMRILGKFLGTKDQEGLVESWEWAAKMPAKPYAVESAVQAVLEHLVESQPKFAQYKPADFIDARTLSDIDKSGYIDKLYGGAAR